MLTIGRLKVIKESCRSLAYFVHSQLPNNESKLFLFQPKELPIYPNQYQGKKMKKAIKGKERSVSKFCCAVSCVSCCCEPNCL
jgi:hypothetical protein